MRLLAFFYLVAVLALATIVATIPGATTTIHAAWHAIDPTRLHGLWAVAVGFIVTLAVSLGWFLAAGGRFEDGGMR